METGVLEKSEVWYFGNFKFKHMAFNYSKEILSNFCTYQSGCTLQLSPWKYDCTERKKIIVIIIGVSVIHWKKIEYVIQFAIHITSKNESNTIFFYLILPLGTRGFGAQVLLKYLSYKYIKGWNHEKKTFVGGNTKAISIYFFKFLIILFVA